MNADFPFKTKPYQHQLDIFNASRDRESFALLLDMGVGKSKITIDTAAWLFSRGRINAVLVIAPKGVYGNWVSDQLPRHMPDFIGERMKIVKWDSSQAKTKKFEARLIDLFQPDPLCLKVLVLNIEALNSKSGTSFDLCKKFLMAHDALMVIDESTRIKRRESQWTQKIIKLGTIAKYRRILTGTPVTNSPMDVYSQFEFLDPDILGHGSFFSFRNRYAVTRKRKLGGHSFTEIVGYQRLPELQEKMRQSAIIIRKEECLDLPPKVYTTRDVEMSDKQQKLYDQLKKLSIAELAGVGVVTVNMALTKILRLHQIVCGCVVIEEYAPEHMQSDLFSLATLDGETSPTTAGGRRVEEIDPDGGPRMDECLDCLEEMSGKVIIWANYTYNVQTITKVLQKKYGLEAVATYSGATPQEEREQIVKNFQDAGHPLRFFVGQTRTGGFGLTLTAAKNMIYFSNDYNLETRLQSEDRAHRIGQDSKVTYVDLICRRTIDEKIIAALKSKQNLADMVTRNGWHNILDD